MKMDKKIKKYFDDSVYKRCPDCGCLTTDLGVHWAISCYELRKAELSARYKIKQPESL